jgi:putative FmdB family regulatory protein
MPTYDYLCQKCEHKFEQMQSITANSLRKCPECGKMSLKRLIGAGAGIIFKGSGFYETDYRSDSYKKDKKAASKPAKSEKSKSDTKDKKAKTSDTKPKEKATKPTKKKNSPDLKIIKKQNFR